MPGKRPVVTIYDASTRLGVPCCVCPPHLISTYTMAQEGSALTGECGLPHSVCYWSRGTESWFVPGMVLLP